MDNAYRFGSVEVTCEGYDYPDDPNVLRGSCGVIISACLPVVLISSPEHFFKKNLIIRGKGIKNVNNIIHSEISLVLLENYKKIIVLKCQHE